MNVPGMKRPNIPVAPVNWQNFWTGIFPYSLAEVTATFEIFALPMNLAATSILARVLLISSIYNPSGFARNYERSHVFGPHRSTDSNSSREDHFFEVVCLGSVTHILISGRLFFKTLAALVINSFLI